MERCRKSRADRVLFSSGAAGRGRLNAPVDGCSEVGGSRLIEAMWWRASLKAGLQAGLCCFAIAIVLVALAGCRSESNRAAEKQTNGKVVGSNWSARDVDRDGLHDWLQLDLYLHLPPNVVCIDAGTTLEDDGQQGEARVLAQAEGIEWLMSRGSVNRVTDPTSFSGEAGQCTLTVGFDGDSLRNRAASARWVANLRLAWHLVDDRTGDPGTHGSIEDRIAAPAQRPASFGRAPAPPRYSR